MVNATECITRIRRCVNRQGLAMSEEKNHSLCEPEDAVSLAKVKIYLQESGAELLEQSWAMGVDVYRYRCGDATFTIFMDAWSVDVSGDDASVKGLLSAVAT